MHLVKTCCSSITNRYLFFIIIIDLFTYFLSTLYISAPWLESVKKNLSKDAYMTLQDSRIEELNIDLILALLIHICKSPPGAVLVFLPGMGDITKLIRAIEHSGNFPRQRFEIYPLHSKLPTLDQRRIFDRPPPHIRKIIIATNIAETSITIDDIVYVIDCGRIKITGLNVDENIQTLQNEFVSKANLMQRYFLFESYFFFI